MKIRLSTTTGVAAFTDAFARARQARWNLTAPLTGSRPTSPARVRKIA
jgi:hypothetical protein